MNNVQLQCTVHVMCNFTAKDFSSSVSFWLLILHSTTFSPAFFLLLWTLSSCLFLFCSLLCLLISHPFLSHSFLSISSVFPLSSFLLPFSPSSLMILTSLFLFLDMKDSSLSPYVLSSMLLLCYAVSNMQTILCSLQVLYLTWMMWCSCADQFLWYMQNFFPNLNVTF